MGVQPGDIVAFEQAPDPIDERPEPHKLYGQVYRNLEGDLSLVFTPEGCTYIVYGWGLHAPEERDSFGRVFWPEWKPGMPVESDPAYVRGATNELARKPSMVRALTRILRNRDYNLTRKQQHEPGAIQEAWEIPIAISVRRGGYHELSGYFLAYLDREPEDRKAEERALRLLMSGKARRGSEQQGEVLLACYYGTLPVAWLADVWHVNRSALHRQYHKAVEFMSYYTPMSFERERKPHRARSLRQDFLGQQNMPEAV